MKYSIGTYTQKDLKTKRAYTRKNQLNKTYNKKHTQRELDKRIKIARTVLIVMFLIGITQWVSIPRTIIIQGNGSAVETSECVPPQLAESVDNSLSVDEVDYENIPYMTKGEVRETTMYNAGDLYQCDDTPCISASGDNICELLAQGTNVCAANWLKIGTIIEVEGLGECIVLDRMAKRFSHRVDWAMQAHEKPEAIAFGLKRLSIKIIK